jgi:hypothetical protein
MHAWYSGTLHGSLTNLIPEQDIFQQHMEL